jgi:hypothetical protein
LYPFARGKEATPAASETLSSFVLSLQRAQVWGTAAVKALSSAVANLSRRLPAAAATAWTSKSAWWNRPMQRRDLWAAGAAAIVVISLVPIARALRNHSHREPVVSAAITAPIASPVGTNPTAQAPITSSVSMINVSSSLVMDPPVMNSDTNITESDSSAMDSPDETAKLPVLVTHAFARHPLSVTKPQPARPAPAKSPTLTHNLLPAYGASLPVSSPVVEAPAPAVIPQTTLRIDIVSGVKDQTLAIYSGDELLLTTPLQPAHLGDTLRFNCPITAGEHALHVVLYRGDKTVFMHKENNSELRPDGTNTMEVRVNRRSKMLVKHETSLEVVWPSSTAL